MSVKRLRLCILHYKINNVIKREVYMFGEILNLRDKIVTDHIEFLAFESLSELLNNKHMMTKEKSSRLLSIELSNKVNGFTDISVTQDFKMRKFKLKDLNKVEGAQLRNLKTYTLNSSNKRLIRFILGKPFDSIINDKVMVNDCDSDTEEIIEKIKTIKGKNKRKTDKNVIVEKNSLEINDFKIPINYITVKEKEVDLTSKTNEVELLNHFEYNKDPHLETINNNNIKINPISTGSDLLESKQSPNWVYGAPDLLNLDSDVRTNILMLLEINFLQYGNFYLLSDRAILRFPCGQAYGDLLKNRFLKYHSSGLQKVKYGISRLGEKDYINLHLKYIY